MADRAAASGFRIPGFGFHVPGSAFRVGFQGGGFGGEPKEGKEERRMCKNPACVSPGSHGKIAKTRTEVSGRTGHGLADIDIPLVIGRVWQIEPESC